MAIRYSTRKQYECYLSKWELYCYERKIDPFSPALEDGNNFLGELYDQGTGYSGLNTATEVLYHLLLYQQTMCHLEVTLWSVALSGVYLKLDHSSRDTRKFWMLQFLTS
jgi:hypothetical protein